MAQETFSAFEQCVMEEGVKSAMGNAESLTARVDFVFAVTENKNRNQVQKALVATLKRLKDLGAMDACVPGDNESFAELPWDKLAKEVSEKVVAAFTKEYRYEDQKIAWLGTETNWLVSQFEGNDEIDFFCALKDGSITEKDVMELAQMNFGNYVLDNDIENDPDAVNWEHVGKLIHEELIRRLKEKHQQ